MNTNTHENTAAEIREALAEYTDNGANGEKFDILTEAASRADVRGDVLDTDGMSHYETSARAFLTMTGATFCAEFLGLFDSASEWNETAPRVRGEIPVWRVEISTAEGSFRVRFRGSINDGANGCDACGVYDVLAALTKTDPGSLGEFAEEYGYFPINSRDELKSVSRVYSACWHERQGIRRTWRNADDLEALAAIN